MVIEQGATFSLVGTLYNPGTPRVPIDFTDCTARMQARRQQSSADVLLDFAPYITLGTTNGKIRVKVPRNITAPIDWDEAVYDFEYDTPDGDTFRLLVGRIRVKRVVTR